MSKRELFKELRQGITEMKQHESGILTLKTYHIQKPEKLEISSKEIKSIRSKLRLSQSVFSRLFRVSKRTLEKWEQGVAKPNEQAAALILLVKKNPKLLNQLAEL